MKTLNHARPDDVVEKPNPSSNKCCENCLGKAGEWDGVCINSACSCHAKEVCLAPILKDSEDARCPNPKPCKEHEGVTYPWDGPKKNYERDHSHVHCFAQENPPCGFGNSSRGKHCCLCDIVTATPAARPGWEETYDILYADENGNFRPDVNAWGVKDFIRVQLAQATASARKEELEWVKRDHPQDWEIDRRLESLN